MLCYSGFLLSQGLIMKLKSLIFSVCVALGFPAFANTPHLHPEANKDTASANTPNLKVPGFCEIEVVNNSFDDVTVYGLFDDGAPLRPFTVYAYEMPHYISLYYYGYCHAGMQIAVDTRDGFPIYSRYTLTNSTVYIVPYLAKQPKIEVKVK